jgi:adenine-specific DNA-methyltransferase
MEQMVQQLSARYLLVSFNNEGYIDRSEMEKILSSRGPVQTLSRPHPRYVGAKIGIHDPSGRKVGKVSHVKNIEHLFLVGEVSLSDEMLEGVGLTREHSLL